MPYLSAMPAVTKLEYCNNHKWHRAIQKLDKIPQYLFYWRGTAYKMSLIHRRLSEGLKDKLKAVPAYPEEEKKYIDVFNEDIHELTGSVVLSEIQKQCLEAVVEQRRQIVKTALFIKGIYQELGKEFLCVLIKKAAEGFAQELHATVKMKNVPIWCKCGDHDIELKKEKEKFIFRIYTCPIVDIFKYVGAESLCQHFCIFCMQHGFSAARENTPFKIQLHPTKFLSHRDDSCQLEAVPENKVIKRLTKILPDFYLFKENG